MADLISPAQKLARFEEIEHVIYQAAWSPWIISPLPRSAGPTLFLKPAPGWSINIRRPF